MGMLVRNDTLRFRQYFKEAVKLVGLSVAYQWVTKQEYTIHSEKNFEYSQPIRMDIILDENPTIETLNTYGWLSELGDTLPIIAHIPFNTPNLKVGCRITLATIKGTDRPRIFEITKIGSNLEYPDSYTVALAPVLDQFPQRNQYTLVNNEKVSQEKSEFTSKEQNSSYTTNTEIIDTTPKQFIEWENNYELISDEPSSYSE
jgi:hypothetical protein